MKIRTIGAELFNADRRTGMAKLIVVFAILPTHLKKGGLFVPELVTEWLKHAVT